MRRFITVSSAIALLALPGCRLLTPAERPSSETRSLVLWMPGASSVQVLADWNEWGGLTSAGGVLDPSSAGMSRRDDGFWELDISHLESGSYRYVFLVNGHRWLRDGTNPVTAVYMDKTVSVIMISH